MQVSYIPLLAALCCFAFLGAAGKKPAAFTLRVHAETTQHDGEMFAIPVTVGNPPVNVHIEKLPIVSEREVVAFYPFPSRYGYGAYFKLNNHGTKSLEALTASQRGRFLVVVFNNRPVARLLVKKEVADGIVFVPDGIAPEETYLIGQRLPHIGESEAAAAQRMKTEAMLLRQQGRP